MRTLRTFLLSALLLLAACSVPTPVPPEPDQVFPTSTASPTPPPETEPAELSSIPVSPDDMQGLSITFRHPWSGVRGDLIASLVNSFNLDNEFEITVTAEQSDNLFESIGRDLDQGTAPAVVAALNYHVLAWRTRADLPELTRYARDPVWGLTEAEQNDFYPAILASATFAGEMTGLPFYRTAEILLYNVSWAQELGFVDPPDTPEALRDQACAAHTAQVAAGEGNFIPHGGLALTYEPTAFLAWMFAFGGGFESSLEGQAYKFNRPENLEAFSFLRTMLDDGCAWTPEETYPREDFAARRALFLQATIAGLVPQQAALQAAGSPDEWAAIPYPGPGNAPSTLFYGPDLVLLPASPEEQLAAWVFIKWLATPENSAAWFDLTGYFPARQSAVPVENPAAAWLPSGVSLPPSYSWADIQWVVSDTAHVLYAPLISVSDVEAIAAQLDLLAEELIGMNR